MTEEEQSFYDNLRRLSLPFDDAYDMQLALHELAHRVNLFDFEDGTATLIMGCGCEGVEQLRICDKPRWN